MNARNVGVLLAVLSAAACRTTANEPSVVAVEPSKARVGELPMTVNILGEGLFHQVRVTVDQRRSPRVLEASVKLGSTELAEPHLQSSNEMTATVPGGLAIGVYDLELTLGNGKTATMPSAFEVMGDGAMLVAPSSSMNSSVGTDTNAAATNGTTTNATVTSDGESQEQARCSSGSFSEPQLIWADTQGPDWGPSLSGDGLLLLFSRVDAASGVLALQWAERASVDAPFQMAHIFDGLSGGNNTTPHLSADRLSIVFMSDRNGSLDLWAGERNGPQDGFGNVQAISGLNSSADEVRPWLSSDGLTIYFESNRDETTGYDLWRATRSDVSERFQAPTQLPGITTTRIEGSPSVTEDHLQLFYLSDSAENPGRRTLFEAARSNVEQEFSPGVAIASLSDYEMNGYASISADGREIVFAAPGAEVQQLFRAVRQCD